MQTIEVFLELHVQDLKKNDFSLFLYLSLSFSLFISLYSMLPLYISLLPSAEEKM